MMRMLVTFTPPESKRLIAKAVTELPEVKKALADHKILISSGSTTGYVVEEITQSKFDIWRYPCGTVTMGRQCQTPDDRIRSVCINKGRVTPPDPAVTDYQELANHLAGFTCDDIYIKGANAIDPEGNAGFLLAHPTGGNIGAAISVIAAQGAHFIIPAGLEKMISSVTAASRAGTGINKYKYSFGRGCGYLAVPNGKIVTEIEALKILAGLEVTHLASGGNGGSEGAVTLLLEGEEPAIDKAARLIRGIKGEKAIKAWKKPCSECTFKCAFQDIGAK